MKVTNKYNLPQPLFNLVNNEYTYKEKQFSATAILQGLKSLILTKRHTDEIEQDVSDMANLIFGLALHKVLEDSQEGDDELKEAYLIYELANGYKVSGRFDLYNETEMSVKDYKTCSVWKLKFKDFDDWKKQLHIYAWLLTKCDFKVDKCEINYFIKDWSPKEFKLAQLKGDYYPEHAIGKVEFTFTKEDFDEIEKYIVERFNQIATYESLEDDDIPVCSEEERWYSGSKWAVKKGTNKTAVRVFDNQEDAEELAKTNPQYWVEFRVGENRKCQDYCNACKWCNFYKENVEVKENGN